MQIDLGGSIWLEDSGPSVWENTNRWWVIDSTGVLVTRVIVPRRVRPGSSVFTIGGAEIGNDYILARGLNSDGADVVRLYRLRKREAHQ
jgi:hypothetical protein